MADRFVKHNLYGNLIDCVFDFECDRSYIADKSYIKKYILDIEVQRWKASCLLYSSLRIFRKATVNIQMNCWWFFAKSMPTQSNKASSVISVLMGNQPQPYQQNFSRDKCALCDDQTYDDNMHVLFDCTGLEPLRSHLFDKLTNSMPHALASDFINLNNDDKAILMLSGYGHKYIQEWKDIYSNTANLIDSLYKRRSNAYDALPIDNG